MKGLEGSPNSGLIWLTGDRRTQHQVGSQLKSIKGYTRKLEGEVGQQHPNRA
jgi:hypothetical protein